MTNESIGALHPVKGRNKWCGPAAFAAVVGVPTHEASRLIRKQSGQKAVRKTDVLSLRRAMASVGYLTERTAIYDWRGLRAAFAPSLQEVADPAFREGQGLVPGHYVVVIRGHALALRIGDDGSVDIVDNITKVPVKVTDIWCAQKKVVGFYRARMSPRVAQVMVQVEKLYAEKRQARVDAFLRRMQHGGRA